MFRFCTSFWALAYTFMFNLFDEFIVKYISRFKASVNNDSQKNDSNISGIHSQEDDQIASINSKDFDSVLDGGKGSFNFSFGFQIEKSKDFDKSIEETESSGFTERAKMGSSTNKYQFMGETDVIKFTEETETQRCMVQEFILGDENEGFLGEKDSQELNLEKVDSELVEIVDHEKTEEFVQSFSSEADLKDQEVTLCEHELCKNKERDGYEDNFSTEQDFSFNEVELAPENKLSISSEDKCLSAQLISLELELQNEPLSDPVIGGSFVQADIMGDEFLSTTQNFDIVHTELLSAKESDTSPMPIDERNEIFNQKIASLEEIGEERTKFSINEAVSSDDEFIELDLNVNSEKLGESEEHDSEKKKWDLDSDEEEEDDIYLWEHRELIEQMKMEMKNARTGGLPTILEEFESSKIGEDLKPLKIDEKFEYKDRMEEIHKFYKCYSEKMRKLDILNYQSMQAISFLQLKDPIIQLSSVKKPQLLAIKSLLLPNIWPYKPRRIYADPTLKSISELHRNLEVVYVGQACLSWEILHWQYGKSKELLNFDSEGVHSYNQVAGDFQKFQVLVQRFIEDESFQGPRVKNYVKNRCILPSFLQVPIIKDDCLKEKRGKIYEEENTVTIAMLVNMIDETMRILWEFFHADKCEVNMILKGPPVTSVDLQGPVDAELFMDTKISLQKKEKRLKQILRSGNCIVKKFQKQGRGQSYNAQFVSQVELRLISRVLRMSRLTTDQLEWCQKKLNNINFVNRKIYVEPIFLLFPC